MNKHKAPPTPTIETILHELLEYSDPWSHLEEAEAKATLLITKAKTTIATPCPACGHTSLIISADNWLVCGNLECNDPAAINGTLKATTEKGKL